MKTTKTLLAEAGVELAVHKLAVHNHAADESDEKRQKLSGVKLRIRPALQRQPQQQSGTPQRKIPGLLGGLVGLNSP